MRKGISPLIAVIMLIAFTMIVAAILAVWAQHYASTQTEQMQMCIEAGIYIHTCKWIEGTEPNGTLKIVVKNTGSWDLTFNVEMEYENDTRHPDIVYALPDIYNITSGEFKTVTIENVGDDLKSVVVNSIECSDFMVYDSITKVYIQGL